MVWWLTISALAADPYALGDGHDGTLLVGALDQQVNDWLLLSADTAAGDSVISLSSAGTLSGGDLLMLVRMGQTDAFPVGTDLSVDIEGTGIGKIELRRVLSLTGTDATLDRPLDLAWPAAETQIVAVPEYTSATINAGASLSAIPWDGQRGGIVAILVEGDLVINGAISSDGAGWRGGPGADNDETEMDCRDLTTPSPDGGYRGEGVTLLFTGGEAGYGNRANGAGGGNCHNSGGGGGGGGGAGGNGGYSQDGAEDYGGRGGAALSHLDGPERLLFGGGGGAGESNDGYSPGSPGGGAVWIRAGRILGAGDLSANGASTSDVTNDGGGGGGAGGTLIVRTLEGGDCPSLSARGGDGASAYGSHGPGGGGGGGSLYWLSPTPCALQAEAGAHGDQPDVSAPGGRAYGSGPDDPASAPYVGVMLQDNAPWATDFDEDGLTDLDEIAHGTDPADADTDGDGLLDGGEDLDADGQLDPGETDPLLQDTDGDGILDGQPPPDSTGETGLGAESGGDTGSEAPSADSTSEETGGPEADTSTLDTGLPPAQGDRYVPVVRSGEALGCGCGGAGRPVWVAALASLLAARRARGATGEGGRGSLRRGSR